MALDGDELAALYAAHAEEEDAGHRARAAEDHPLTSWDAVAIPEDLTPELPVLLRRTDGRALLYPGKTHSFVGEPESGKTWAALAAGAETLARGASVMYVDFEDSVKGVVRRLVALGANLPGIRQQFAYIRPDAGIGSEGAKHSLVRTGERYQPELIVLDGVTECMALHGWDINSATDAARFLDWFPRLWERTGAAVVMIDHVVKSKDGDGRGRWAIGSQHKLAGVNGASYTFNVEDRFGRGRHGRAVIGIAKDREGAVREHAHDGEVAGVFNLRGREDGSASWDIEPYDQAATLQTFGAKIVDALGNGPLSKKALEKAVGGESGVIRDAVEALRMRGQVKVRDNVPKGHAHMVELVEEV